MALDHDTGLVLVAAVAALPATIGAIAALRNGRQSTQIKESLKDGNGDDVPIGQMVYEQGKTLEVVQAQMHDNQKTMSSMREEYLGRFERLEAKAMIRKRRAK